MGQYSDYATIAAGGAIGGGAGNVLYGGAIFSVIGGGYVNSIYTNADQGVIGGGDGNSVRGSHGVVPGGRDNSANGAYSFAAGRSATANHDSCFVWSEPPSGFFDFGAASTAANQFVVMASGGVQLNEDTSIYFGARVRQMLNLWGSAYGIGVQASTLCFRCNAGGPNEGFAWYKGGTHHDDYANPGGGVELMHLVSGGLYVNGTFVSGSDRNAKENIAAVSPREILDKVVSLPISQWNSKDDASSRHLGPMAQNFHAAFGVGPDDKHIATVDADGVALAAIQGLNQKVEEQRAENAELKRELSEIKQLLFETLRQKGLTHETTNQKLPHPPRRRRARSIGGPRPRHGVHLPRPAP
jgi:hypothetical protein